MTVVDYIHPPRTMLEAFMSLPEGTLAQLIENNIVMSPSPLKRHQSISMELSSELHFFVKTNRLGEVYAAPFDVHLDSTNVFQPDICFISKKRLHMLKKNGMFGAPDLVIEILSPGTSKHDLVDKKAVYERCGVTELWFVDPENDQATGYHLRENKYQSFFTGTGKLQSQLLDFVINF